MILYRFFEVCYHAGHDAFSQTEQALKIRKKFSQVLHVGFNVVTRVIDLICLSSAELRIHIASGAAWPRRWEWHPETWGTVWKHPEMTQVH